MRIGHCDNVVRSSSPLDDNVGDIEMPSVRRDTEFEKLASNSNNSFFLRANLKILNDPEVFREYMSSKKRFFDFISILPTVTIFYISIATRYNWSNIAKDNPLFSVFYTLIFAGTVLFVSYFISHVIIYFTPTGRRQRLPQKISNYILFSAFGGRIEDILCIFSTLSTGFCLLARVYKGQCQDNTDIWESQGCNPVAAMNSIPHDQVMVLYLIPIMIQFILRGVSVHALVLSWACNLFFVIFSIVHVRGWFQIWTILYSLIFMNINLEVERLMRVFFVQNKLMLAANRLSTDRKYDNDISVLNSTHRIKLLETSSENEKKLAESERIQLRSLMGNVAHDLKTPLHSIKADLEMLSLLLSKIPKDAIGKAVALLQSSFFQQNFDPQSLFNTMDATCKFMMMSINRSQDFMKASNNIALYPALKTFDLEAAVAISVNCIKHIESDRLIVVHPLDENICGHLISDEHWLIENMLCLLSNAMKYSDNGHADVHIKVIDASIRGNLSSSSIELDKDDNIQVRVGNEIGTQSDFSADAIADKCVQPETNDEMKRMVLVTIEDFGIGISEDAREGLFQPFKQAQRMAGGTGLGLYSLLKRVEALGGEAGVASRNDLNQGSMFWFTFPYRPDVAAAALQAPGTPGTPKRNEDFEEAVTASELQVEFNFTDPTSLIGKHILLIDDSPSVLRVTSRFLLMNGHTVVTAANGCAGLEMLKENYATQLFDMVITDIQMPVMDGLEATSRFRTFEREEMAKGKGCEGKRLLIVGMSANSDDRTKLDAMNAEMDYFITKPFAYIDLTHVLSNPVLMV